MSECGSKDEELDDLADAIQNESAAENCVDDGGSAFPHDEFTKDGNHYKVHSGMSLLDYFAGQALAKIIHSGVNESASGDAADAYMYAQAMIEERERLYADSK